MSHPIWEQISEEADRRIRLEVPEWEGIGHAVVWSQPCTVEDESRCRRATKADGDDPVNWARLVWQKLEDESGKRIFEGVDFGLFKRKVRAPLARELGMAIYAAATTVEEARGN